MPGFELVSRSVNNSFKSLGLLTITLSFKVLLHTYFVAVVLVVGDVVLGAVVVMVASEVVVAAVSVEALITAVVVRGLQCLYSPHLKKIFFLISYYIKQ